MKTSKSTVTYKFLVHTNEGEVHNFPSFENAMSFYDTLDGAPLLKGNIYKVTEKIETIIESMLD